MMVDHRKMSDKPDIHDSHGKNALLRFFRVAPITSLTTK